MGKKEQVPARAILCAGFFVGWETSTSRLPHCPSGPCCSYNLFVHPPADLRNVGPAPSLVSPRAHRRARQSGLSREPRSAREMILRVCVSSRTPCTHAFVVCIPGGRTGQESPKPWYVLVRQLSSRAHCVGETERQREADGAPPNARPKRAHQTRPPHGRPPRSTATRLRY